MRKSMLFIVILLSVSWTSAVVSAEQNSKNEFPTSVSEVGSMINLDFLANIDLQSCQETITGLMNLEVLMNHPPSEHFMKIKNGCFRSSNDEKPAAEVVVSN